MLNFLFTKTPLMFLVQSFWRDEAFSYILAKRSILQILFLTAKDFNPPLYYLILHFWIKLFGNTEIALRIPSFIFYWATIYAAFMFLNEILKLNTKKSFLYLILFIVNPILFYYGFEARMYTAFTFFATLSFFYFFKKDYRLYTILTVLGLYTHYFMLFVILTQLIFNYIENKRKKNYLILRNKLLLPILFFIPWLIFVFSQGQFFTSSFWVGKMDLQSFFNFLGTLYTGYEGWPGLLAIITPLFSFFLIVIVLISLKYFRKNSLFLLLSLWGILVPLMIAIVSFIKPVFFSRYLIFSSIGLIIFLIFIMEKSNKFFRVLIFTVLLLVSIAFQIVQIKTRENIDMRKPVAEIGALMKKNDRLYVISELDFFTAEYYLDENRVYIYNKSYDSIPDYAGKVLIPKAKIATTLPFYPSKAFILNSDGGYSIQALY